MVALNPRPIPEWNQTDRLNLHCLLQVSILVLCFSLLPFLLLLYQVRKNPQS